MPLSLIGESGEPRRQLRKLLLWPLILSILFGIAQVGEPLDDSLRVARNLFHVHSASGDIVLVQVDDKSLREIGDWPWPRSTQAKVYSEIDRLGARKIVSDVSYKGATDPAEDAALARTLEKLDNISLLALTRGGQGSGQALDSSIYPMFKDRAKLATGSVAYNWQSVVWQVPTGHRVNGEMIPSLAMAMAERIPSRERQIKLDYSLDPRTFPTVSASDVLRGRVDPRRIRDKVAVFATNSIILGDQYLLPGWTKLGGVYVQMTAAETLKRGTPIDLGWLPSLLLALLISLLAGNHERMRYLACGAGALLVIPYFLERSLVFADIAPGLFMIAVVAGRMAWRRLRAERLVNTLSGLPNLTGLRMAKDGQDLPLVAVRIHNYAEIASTLDSDGEKKFVNQVVQRLTPGNRERIVYQGDEGIFAWFADKGTPFASHLEALHALFRSPIRVDSTAYDVSLSFGVELGSSRSISSRLGSALVAAQEAEAESLKWKYHDPARMHEVPWRLSLLSQLDEAIEKGQVWLAFQPKVDLATRRTVGAEALARWTHPEKGPISPTEFVSAAEQSDRISHLTDFVLDQAIGAAAKVNREGIDFDIAVNLSARMLNDRDLPRRLSKFLSHHALPADKLVLELTETAAVSESGGGIDLLLRLRDLGVRIAIDDYGTGLSTLDYLKKMPASELKIDQSFVRAMRENRSDLIMVQSTITLAHSLGSIVVAEGVEDPVSLDRLKEMGCDQAQGFVVGRPMSLDEMLRRLRNERKRSAAA